ncbi:MAG: AAA family ATPase [Lachnospira sp.]
MDDKEFYLKKAKMVLKEVKKSVVGKDEVICKVLMAILADGHVLLDDIPGVGKTTLADSFATVLGLDWNRVQFTPDVMPSDIMGFNMYNRQTNKFEFKAGAAMCNLLLADEINRTSPKTQSALLQVMEEGNVSVDGKTYPLPDPFVVIATQNPVGSVGTQKLPESQMDRFMVRLSMGYPTLEDEITILKSKQTNLNQRNVSSRILEPGELSMIKEAVNDIYVDDSIFEYVAKVAKATRESSEILVGISPRGSIATIAMAKAEAFLRGNTYVLPSDIHNIITDVCAHRIVVNNSFKHGSKVQQKILVDVLKKVPVPDIERKGYII